MLWYVYLRKCINCPTKFKTTRKTRNRKYCDICKLIIWKQQKREYDKRKSDKRKFNNSQRNMKCVLCSISLPENCHISRKYCVKCKRKQYYVRHPIIKNSAKIIKLLKNRMLQSKELADKLNLPNGTVRTTVYNMRKSGVNILTINDRYVMI